MAEPNAYLMADTTTAAL